METAIPPRLVDLVCSLRAKLLKASEDLRTFHPSESELLPASSVAASKAEIEEAATYLDGLGLGPTAKRLRDLWGKYMLRGTDVLLLVAPDAGDVLIDQDKLDHRVTMFAGVTAEFSEFCGDLEGQLNAAPKQYCMSWREILNTVGLTNTTENRNRVRGLNGLHAGPIICVGRGGQPKVNRVDLLRWWNSLEERWKELDDRDRDRAATVAEHHSYGRDGP